MFKFYGIFSQSESRHRCIQILRILKQFVYEMSRIRIKFIQYFIESIKIILFVCPF